MKTPRTTYFLIDWENVQPKNLSALNVHSIQVLAFIGANQRKLLAKVKNALQHLGTKSKCIQVERPGKNALDFLIAFTLGALSKSEPKPMFYVVSKDTGYDALLDHLENEGFDAKRIEAIPQVPIPRIGNHKSGRDKLERIVQNLVSRGDAKPLKRAKLCNAINSLFANSLKDRELTTLVRKLEELEYIQFGKGDFVNYDLPDPNGSPKPPVSAP